MLNLFSQDVAIFYGYWQSYCTAMSFYWVDKYDIRGAETRWMEKVGLLYFRIF